MDVRKEHYVQGGKIIIAIIAVVFFIFYNAFWQAQQEQWGYGKIDYTVFYVVGASITGQLEIEPNQVYLKKYVNPHIRELREPPGGFRYLYPPQALLFFAPLAAFSFDFSYQLWAFLSSVIFIAIYYITIGILDRKIFRLRYSAVLLVLTFSSNVYEVLRTGSINGLLLLCMLLGVVLLSKEHTKMSSVFFAIATSIKIFPGIFLLYSFLRRKWKSVFWQCVFIGVIFLVSLPIVGFDTYQSFYEQRIQTLSNGKIGKTAQQISIYGSYIYGRGDAIGETELRIVDSIHMLLFFAVVVACFFLWKRKDDENPILDYGIIIGMFLLFSKGVHQQYHIWFWPVLLYILNYSIKQRSLFWAVIGVSTTIFTQYWLFIPKITEATIFYFRPAALSAIVLFISVIYLRFFAVTPVQNREAISES